jgi:hypothetical protein
MHCAALSEVREIRWTERFEDHIARHQVTPDEVEVKDKLDDLARHAEHGRPQQHP